MKILIEMIMATVAAAIVFVCNLSWKLKAFK